jgi:hypothetical protein
MAAYIIGFLAAAFFPLALAGYGGHLAVMAMPENGRGRKKALWIVWSLAILGVIASGISTVIAYRADRDRGASDAAFHSEVFARLQEIKDEPSEGKKKQDATALSKAIRSVPPGSYRLGVFTQETLPNPLAGSRYKLKYMPTKGSPIILYYNGLVQLDGQSYTVTGDMLTLNFQATSGDSVWVTYYH